MSSYQEFIDSKHFKSVDAGFAYSTQNSNLFDYQRSCVEWALARRSFNGRTLHEFTIF